MGSWLPVSVADRARRLAAMRGWRSSRGKGPAPWSMNMVGCRRFARVGAGGGGEALILGNGEAICVVMPPRRARADEISGDGGRKSGRRVDGGEGDGMAGARSYGDGN